MQFPRQTSFFHILQGLGVSEVAGAHYVRRPHENLVGILSESPSPLIASETPDRDAQPSASLPHSLGVGGMPTGACEVTYPSFLQGVPQDEPRSLTYQGQ